MSEVVDHLAELTGYRDRDVMDVTLVGSLRDLLEPLSVAIYRCVGETPNERWLTRARMSATDPVATADPLWADLETLPLLADHAARLECFRSRTVIVVPGMPCITLFPLANDREVVGVLEVQSVQALDMAMRRMVSSVLRIYHNFQGLLDYSERDTLTGLLNRKTFDESFLKATMEMPAGADGRRHWGSEARYWLGLIDIDHFKSVNDRFGHLIGDEVLLLLARLMRSSFRFHDQLYRFGGEEFVVLMRCDKDVDAALAFERLRRNTEHYGFPQVGHITVSVGYSEVKPSDSPAAAFERADKAVYHAKAHGRNQVFSYADLVAAGHFKDEDEKVGAMELF
ncbi:MAG: GGDEF domain-containing protein [Burkholderiaceae bacterium]|nr:GGDEF domain-containing protein [Burkholderiaceae bacterium]